MSIPAADRDLLRSLAARYRAQTDTPAMEARREEWRDHNDLLRHTRPKVLCCPEGAWCELLPDSALGCSDPWARGVEGHLRRQLHTLEVLRDDHAMDPFFGVGWQVDWGGFGVEVKRTHGADRGSWKHEPPIKDLKEDVKRLRFRTPKVDRAASDAALNRAQECFGDLLPVRRHHGRGYWTDGLTIELIDLIGLDRLMTAMLDEPDDLHALMAWMRDERLHATGELERQGLLTLNHDGDYCGSGSLCYTRQLPKPAPGETVGFRHLWGFAESQETVGVSPRMFAQFILPYQLPLTARFGLNYYGCCEGLDKRIDHVLKVPNLRKVSISPWANEEVCARKLGRSIIYCRKPMPTLVCSGFDEGQIRADLRKTLRLAGDCQLEFIMKDTHTVERQPWRLAKWCAIAKEEVDAFWEDRQAGRAYRWAAAPAAAA